MFIAQLLELYGLAVKLFIYCCVVDLLLHCSAAVSMSKLIMYVSQGRRKQFYIGQVNSGHFFEYVGKGHAPIYTQSVAIAQLACKAH